MTPELISDDRSGTLISHFDRIGANQVPIEPEFLFTKEERKNLNFEILFVALIATSVLAVPKTTTILDPLAVWVSFGLIALTTVRRIGLDNEFVDSQIILSKTSPTIWILSHFGITYLIISLSQWVFPSSTPRIYLLTGIGMTILFLSVSILYELFFKDLMLWAAVLFYNEYLDVSGLFWKVVWLEMANFCLNMSTTRYNEDHYAIEKIRHHWQGGSEVKFTRRISLISVFSLLVLVVSGAVGIGIPFWWYSNISLPVSATIHGFLSVASVSLSGVLTFFYVRYGTSSYDETPKIVRTFLVLVLTIYLHAGFFLAIILIPIILFPNQLGTVVTAIKKVIIKILTRTENSESIPPNLNRS